VSPRLLRLAGAATRAARANIQRLPVPLKVNLSVTYWCQYRCKTCNIWHRKPENELTTTELLAFVRANRKVCWLDVTGGEIFLRPDIGEVLDAIVSDWRRLALLHFPTNGFLTDRILQVVRQVRRRRGPAIVVTVSVDGPEALNDEIRGVRSGFARQMETVNALRAISDVHVVIGMTLSRWNAGRVVETFEACRKASSLTIFI
jgi:MoaA/NifB/PqqE/SkfB family radical SAM enzyme